MIHAEVEQLLKQTMGLDAASIGSSAIRRAVAERLAACGLEDPAAYWEHLRTSAQELQELIEAVVVPETWFFRDRGAFEALARLAWDDWLQGRAPATLRLLSLPCASGEEPYSMAMALLDLGVPASRFQIDAIDISERALAQARRAVYGRNSFRGGELGFRDQHFETAPAGYRLSPAVRQQVRFRQGNFLAADVLAGAGLYDAIFCRNLLIYFDRATQDSAVAALRRLLTDDGVLFVGPSEAGLVSSQGFLSIKAPLAFAFRKTRIAPAEAVAPRAQRARPAAARRPSPPAAPVPKPEAVVPLPPRVPAAPAKSPEAPADAGLDAAARLADQGRLAEAAAACEELLRLQGPSARLFYLMGLIAGAADRLPQAIDCYRKALYLDPVHTETLVHLAVLLDRQGDAAGARLLRKRIRQSAQKSVT